MFKAMSIVGFLLLALTGNAYGQDSDRIDQLERQVQELELRLAEIEALFEDSSELIEVLPAEEGWQSLSNWRQLSRGMSPDEVQYLLGEPLRVQGGRFTTWFYDDTRNGSKVVFESNKVYKWEEP